MGHLSCQLPVTESSKAFAATLVAIKEARAPLFDYCRLDGLQLGWFGVKSILAQSRSRTLRQPRAFLLQALPSCA